MQEKSSLRLTSAAHAERAPAHIERPITAGAALLVDDENHVRASAAEMLGDFGYTAPDKKTRLGSRARAMAWVRPLADTRPACAVTRAAVSRSGPVP